MKKPKRLKEHGLGIKWLSTLTQLGCARARDLDCVVALCKLFEVSPKEFYDAVIWAKKIREKGLKQCYTK